MARPKSGWLTGTSRLRKPAPPQIEQLIELLLVPFLIGNFLRALMGLGARSEAQPFLDRF
jgi:hypothetical protein